MYWSFRVQSLFKIVLLYLTTGGDDPNFRFDYQPELKSGGVEECCITLQATAFPRWVGKGCAHRVQLISVAFLRLAHLWRSTRRHRCRWDQGARVAGCPAVSVGRPRLAPQKLIQLFHFFAQTGHSRSGPESIRRGGIGFLLPNPRSVGDRLPAPARNVQRFLFAGQAYP